MLKKSLNIPFKKLFIPFNLHTRNFSTQLSVKPYLEFGCQLDIKVSFLKAKRWFMVHVFKIFKGTNNTSIGISWIHCKLEKFQDK
jgi:hypothetical protein